MTDTYTPVLTDEQIVQVRRSMRPLQMLNEYARAVERAAIEAYQRQQWQPIETAPKDGRTLLLGRLNANGNWRTMRGQWMSADYISESWEDPDDTAPGWFETAVEAEDPPNCWPIEPTHWMPLPLAPDLPTATVDNLVENPMTDLRQQGLARVEKTLSGE